MILTLAVPEAASASEPESLPQAVRASAPASANAVRGMYLRMGSHPCEVVRGHGEVVRARHGVVRARHEVVRALRKGGSQRSAPTSAGRQRKSRFSRKVSS